MTGNDRKIRKLCMCAIVAALYAAMTVVFAPISYGAVQCRIAEVLCLLPFIYPESVWGLFIGCFLANLMSGNLFDIIFGSFATLLSALCIAAIGRRGHGRRQKLMACLMPVLFNALIVGAVITGAYEGKPLFQNLRLYALNALYVAAGEAAAMYAIAWPLLELALRKNLFSKK